MMDTRKLDKWAEQLLDTGKRNNNLISFKNTRFSTAEVLFPSSHELFEKAKGIVSFEVFDPKDIEEINDDDEDCDDLISRKADYLALYSRKIRRQNQILVYNAVSSPPNIVKRIGKKAKEFIDETGVNVALTFEYGLVNDFLSEWCEMKTKLNNGEISPNEYFEWKITWPHA